jgi:uncharacterized protein with PIN domain
MKRRAFFGLVMGSRVLDAQSATQSDAFNAALRALDLKVPNALCPVCGVDSPPVSRQAIESVQNCKPSGSEGLVNCDKREVTYGPNEVLIRCSKCNVAFWQDAQ